MSKETKTAKLDQVGTNSFAGKTDEELRGILQTLILQRDNDAKLAEQHQTRAVKAQGAIEVVSQLVSIEEGEESTVK
tara:strand:+ start:205 stop:435 length:231 start_codon:yes stop_codon:yes gene_type:complete